ncbi:ATP-binding cassette domain-containing protein [Halobacillus sp. BBL2006]|uniref:ATP-binding cassette domain-containing protein n=1 Tax=Halobacillus sp. BBL2006 TaxID=1543706 RepID=UPI000543D73E|nr:ATP-binding cassette domain-containing protein [Halobacillus sp. BBL2006]KHE68291.1 ABC transporter [Halobacillus sp. BBL2006]
MLELNFQKQLTHFPLNVRFDINKEIVILFGPSGSGKTTILNCIAGLTHPDEGRILLNDRSLYRKGKKPVPVQHRKIGYLFQDYALFPHMTVKKNIEYGASEDSLVNQLTKVVCIEHLMNKFPRQISGGEKQRVALVRALATQPDLLLLDEPFSSLDTKTKEECHHELKRLHKIWKIPIILVTHDEQEAKKLGDRIIYMNQGDAVE